MAANGAPRGLLIEQAATNRLRHSTDFTHSTWEKANLGTVGLSPVVSASTYVAPDGSMDAMQVALDAVDGTGQSRLMQYVGHPVAGDYTLSVWMRVADGAASRNLRIRMDYTGGSVAQNILVTDAWNRYSITLLGAPDPKVRNSCDSAPCVIDGHGGDSAYMGGAG